MALGASAAVVVGGGVEFSFVSSSKIEGMETPLIELFANRIEAKMIRVGGVGQIIAKTIHSRHLQSNLYQIAV